MWILFNKKNVDNFVKSSTIIAGKHVDKIAIKIKEKEQPTKPFEDIMAEFVKFYEGEGNFIDSKMTR